MDPLIDQTLDHFRIDAMLGEGGMGAVYKAFDTKLNVHRALKVMDPYLARQPGFQQRFQTEAQAAASLDHPGIVGVHHFGEARLQSYLTIGRGPENDLDIPSSARASRHHALIEFDGKKYTVTDLDSRNGTFLESSQLLPNVPEVQNNLDKTYLKYQYLLVKSALVL